MYLQDINSKSFGAAISARMPPGAKSTAVPYIDSVEITVYYSFPGICNFRDIRQILNCIFYFIFIFLL